MYLNDNQEIYVTSLIKRLDLENEYDGFLQCDSGGYESITAGWLIDSNIKENKIFEMKVGNDLKPIVLDDNISDLPTNCQPLSLKNLELLSELVGFLVTASDGISIT